MPKPVVCPVWPSFDANPKVERGLNRACPVGQSCHTLFPHRNPTDPRLWSEACRLESERCTGSIDCILHSIQASQKATTGSDDVMARRTWGGRPTGDQSWQLIAGCCSGRWQLLLLACLAAALLSSNRQSYNLLLL